MSPFLPNAGTCEKCGYNKTWEFKILNPKTGKQMPAHIDDLGALLNNDGGCGKYHQPPTVRVQGASNGTIFAQKPAPVVAAPAPIGNQAPDHRVALALGLAGGPGPKPGKANAGATRDTLYDECLIMLDNIASNVLTIKAKLAELSKK